jgi:hypothetical protein
MAGPSGSAIMSEKLRIKTYSYEKGNLEIRHSDDNRHSDGYRNQPGSNFLHGQIGSLE